MLKAPFKWTVAITKLGREFLAGAIDPPCDNLFIKIILIV